MRLDVRIAAPETSQPSNASQLRSLRSRWSLCPGREPSLSGAEFFVNEAMSVTALRHRRGRQPGRLGARDVGGRARRSVGRARPRTRHLQAECDLRLL